MIDVYRVIKELEAVVEGKEDFVYNPDKSRACVYIEEGKPSCIIGHVLTRIGFSTEEIAKLDHAANGASISADAIWKHFGAFTSSVCNILHVAQNAQDSGESWGAALEQARDRAYGYPDARRRRTGGDQATPLRAAAAEEYYSDEEVDNLLTQLAIAFWEELDELDKYL